MANFEEKGEITGTLTQGGAMGSYPPLPIPMSAIF